MRHLRCLKWRKSIKSLSDAGEYMKNIGFVTEVLENKVMVRVVRKSSCGGNCADCGGCSNNTVTIECLTDEPLEVGDIVRLDMKNKTFFRNIFWGYGQTILFTVSGAFFGYKFFASDGASVLGAGIGLCFGIILAKLIFSKKKNDIFARKADVEDRKDIC